MRKLHYWLMGYLRSVGKALLSKNRQDGKLVRSLILRAGNSPEQNTKSATFVLKAANQKATMDMLSGFRAFTTPSHQNLLRQLIIGIIGGNSPKECVTQC